MILSLSIGCIVLVAESAQSPESAYQIIQRTYQHATSRMWSEGIPGIQASAIYHLGIEEFFWRNCAPKKYHRAELDRRAALAIRHFKIPADVANKQAAAVAALLTKEFGGRDPSALRQACADRLAPNIQD
ncbi:MAG: hypothetical protein QM805_11660 [Pseudomonas sp.]